MSISRFTGQTLACIAVTLILAQASAEDGHQNEPVPVLPEVLVTGANTLPYTTYEVTEENLRTHRAPRTLPQALARVPSVSVQQTAYGQESPYIRGFTGFRTLLLVDGIRVNNATFREGPNQYWGLVDPLAIQRIHVVLGPSSVLYGSDAIGGTVNAFTFENLPAGFHPGLYYRYESAALSQTFRADALANHREKFEFAGGVTWRDHDDLTGGRDTGLQPETGFDSLSGDARVTWMAREALRITAAFQSSDQFNVPRTHSTVDAVSFEGTTVGTDLKRELDQTRRFAYLRSEWLSRAEFLESVTLTLSYQLMSEEEVRVRGSGVVRNQGFDDYTGGMILTAVSPSPVGTFTYGAEYYGDWIRDSFRRDFNSDGSLRSERPRGPVADDARYDSLGAFVQHESRPTERLDLVLGARYNFARARADAENLAISTSDIPTTSDLDEDYNAVVGSGRLLYHLTEHLSPYVGVSQGFRAPNLSDLTRFDASRSGEEERPATDLDPERFISYEGGLQGQWARWGASASYFYTDIRDMIIRFPTGEVTTDGDLVVTKDNVGDGYMQGVELRADWNFHEGFTVFGSFFWMDGQVETFVDGSSKETKPISRIPPTQWFLGLRHDDEKGKWWVETTASLVLKQDRLSPRDKLDNQRIPPGGTPGYVLLGLRGGIQASERLKLFAGVENMTDEDYRVHGSGVNGPGTSLVAGLEFRL